MHVDGIATDTPDDAVPQIIEDIEQDEREFLEAFGAKPIESVSETDTRIDWLLERIAKRRKLIAQNDDVARARHDQIEDWHAGENAKIERAIEWFRYQIRELVPADVASFESHYGKKSRALPFGTVGFRLSPPKLEIFDVDKALAWAKRNNVPTKKTETVSKTVLKKALSMTDEEPDGFDMADGSDDFYIKTDVAK